MPSGSLITAIGRVGVIAEGERVSAVRIGGHAPESGDEPTYPLVREALAQLGAWFGGRLVLFDLPLARAHSARGQQLRDAIATVPSGETMSYGTVARMIGSSPRAVGQACARNAFPIVIPCHRIVGAAGAIGHYSAGEGLATKRWLLAHEAKDVFDG